MEISIADQIALDDALVAPTDRLKIGKCNLRLSSDVTSKEATLQVAYDVLKLTPFYKAFQVSADVPEIYMQEFWATAYVHNRSVRFKMNNKKHILNLDQFRDILQICPNSDPSIPRRNKVNWHYVRDDPMFTTINVISRNKDTQLYGTILPAELTNEDIRNSESYKEYYAIASGKIPPKTKASKKKADSDATIKQKPPTVPKEKKGKKTGKGKQKAKELETISEAILTKAKQLKIIPKRSRTETISGAYEGTGVSPGVPDAPDYDSDDDISWKSSEDDQDEDKNEDDENVQDDDDDAKSGDDDEAQTESEDDGDDFIHPKLTTHDDETTHEEETNEDDTFDPTVHKPSHVSSSDDKYSDNEVERGRDDVKADVVLPQVQATQEIEDSHVTLTLVNPDGQQQSSSVSSGFVSNMLNPNQDTEAQAENQQFLDSIDKGMKKVIKEQVKSEVLKIAPQIENYRSDIQRQFYKALVDAYEADKILLDTYGDMVTLKRPRDGADDEHESLRWNTRGTKRKKVQEVSRPESSNNNPNLVHSVTGSMTVFNVRQHLSVSDSICIDPVSA
ncbi:hypothetical protein Tco_0557267 [Tanacetum coccineum]